MKTAVIGGGAAGFFLAVNLKEAIPEMAVTIFERSHHVLSKVAVSGGGRCNCTNTFAEVRDLSAVYPRGHRLMKRLFKSFDYRDAYEWFEHHGVPLVTQEDHCVFPAAQDSKAIIDCFLTLARRYQIEIRLGEKISSLDDVAGYDFVVVTTGGSPTGEGLKWLARLGHELEPPVPSLFSLRIDHEKLCDLMGTVVDDVTVHLPGTKFRADGPLLITHWGVSGPAILKLSSYAARYLAEQAYNVQLSVNWLQSDESHVQSALMEMATRQPQKQLTTYCPFGLSLRLWNHLLTEALGGRSQLRWSEMSRKDMNRLTNTLVNITYPVAGRAPFKDEFVTCGGVSLKSIDPSTLESRHVPHLYFAGEVLDIDGITGGFNFQAAWTTAYVVHNTIKRDVLRYYGGV
ncbi:MAG: NAD(P)/FAD-dependent oxidoreductase [Prevotella sp.]|nr:NAD(P)/FAD-dependent oxidoreductase [Prevotella sp.]